MSQEDRAKAQQLEETLRQQKQEKRREIIISEDFAGRVTERRGDAGFDIYDEAAKLDQPRQGKGKGGHAPGAAAAASAKAKKGDAVLNALLDPSAPIPQFIPSTHHNLFSCTSSS